MEKVLFSKKWSSATSWASSESGGQLAGFITFTMYFDWSQGLRFSTSVPNYTFCSRNPFKSIFDVLEHESIGNSANEALEQRIAEMGLSQKL